MRHSRFKFLSAMFLATALGCGATENVRGPVVAPPSAVQHPEPAKAEPDRSPVATPSGLIALGRVRAPARLTDQLLEWAELPVDWRSLLASEGGGLAEVVDLDAPIEFAATIGPDNGGGEPELRAVITAGLTSLDKAVDALRAAGVEVAEQKPGVYRVQGHDSTSCSVAVALGSSPARVVCGDEQALDELLPFATRGLPAIAISDADVSVQVLAEPVRKRFAVELGRMREAGVPWLLREYSLDSPHFDRALADTLRGVAAELFSALDHAEMLTFEGRLDQARGTFRLDAEFVMSPSDSLLSRTVTELADRASAPSTAFWAIPRDVETVGWSDLGGTPATAAIRDSAIALLRGWLEEQKVEPRTLQAVPDAVDLAVGPRAALVSVSGRMPTPRAASQVAPEWFAYGLARPLKEVERELDALVAIGKSPALRKALPDWKFKVRKERRAASAGRHETIEYRLALPSSLSTYLATSRAADAAKPDSSEWFILVQQGGDQTWIIAAESRSGAEWALHHVGDEALATLEREPALEFLRASRGFCAGAFTLGGILNSLVEAGVVGATAAKPGEKVDAVWLPYTCSATRDERHVRIGAGFELQRPFFAAGTRAMLNSLGGLFGR